MSDLIAIAYPDEPAAARARARPADAVEQGLLDVADVVVIAYGDDDGRIVPVLGAWKVGFAAAGGGIAGGTDRARTTWAAARDGRRRGGGGPRGLEEHVR